MTLVVPQAVHLAVAADPTADTFPTAFAVLAGAAAAAAVGLGLAGRGSITAGNPPDRSSRYPRPQLVVGLLALLLVTTFGVTPGGAQTWILAAGVAVVSVVVRRLMGNHAARRLVAQRQARALEFCDALAAELQGGLPTKTALERACGVWHELAPVAATSRLGGDVVTALCEVAQLPGARELRAVAAAWDVASRSGGTLATVVERVAVMLRHEADARAEVTAALGPPRATALMLMVLPLFGLGLGTSIGADPVHFLLSSSLGLGCLFGGLLLSLLGVAWVERLATAAES